MFSYFKKAWSNYKARIMIDILVHVDPVLNIEELTKWGRYLCPRIKWYSTKVYFSFNPFKRTLYIALSEELRCWISNQLRSKVDKDMKGLLILEEILQKEEFLGFSKDMSKIRSLWIHYMVVEISKGHFRTDNYVPIDLLIEYMDITYKRDLEINMDTPYDRNNN